MLGEKILTDYKEAMKAKDGIRSSTLSFLRAELLNAAIARKKDSLDDAEIIAVIQKQIKQRQDAIAQFRAGNRSDLADKEAAEVAVLQAYLPPQLGEAELKKIIAEVVASSGAAGMGAMGAVMKEVSQRTAGRADGKKVSELVRAHLFAGGVAETPKKT